MSDFTDPDSHSWQSVFSLEVVSEVLKIPISKGSAHQDKVVRHYASNGLYSVEWVPYCLAEELILKTRETFLRSSSAFIPWKKLGVWWRVCRNLLATKDNSIIEKVPIPL